MGRTIERGAARDAQATASTRALSAFVRHARRGGADRGRRARAISMPIADAIAAIGARGRRARRRRCSAQPASRSSSRRCIRATSSRSASACCAELVPRRARSSPAARRRRHRAHDRRRGGRAARAVARYRSTRLRATARSPAGTASASRCRPTRSAAPPSIDWLAALARSARPRIPVRLVKGAYWDTEIKRAQEQGLAGYPVFTRKAHTDVVLSRLRAGACSTRATRSTRSSRRTTRTRSPRCVELRRRRARASSSSACTAWARRCTQVVQRRRATSPCRVYAPVGSHEDLLPYLVRRLLENGANTSFVNRIADARCRSRTLVADPVEQLRRLGAKPQSAISAAARAATAPSAGTRPASIARRPARRLARARRGACAGAAEHQSRAAAPIVGTVQRRTGTAARCSRPGRPPRAIGERRRGRPARPSTRALDALAHGAACAGTRRRRARARDPRARGRRARSAIAPSSSRCSCAKPARRCPTRSPKCARRPTSAATTRCGARRSSPPATSCRARPARRNELAAARPRRVRVHPPWNFPLAIFTGQVAAALAAGNAVVAKPAEQTPLVAAHAVAAAASTPACRADVLHAAAGRRRDGRRARWSRDPRIAGVAFTGSTETAQRDQPRARRARRPIVPLIAETGGQNAMIVDSSALPEQVVTRRAALGVQQRRTALLGAARAVPAGGHRAARDRAAATARCDELVVGDPALLATDVGPVIDDAARGRARSATSSAMRDARPR